jgi:hypothetical protein
MSALSDFTNVLVKDSRIAGITDQLSYSVQSGASSNTYQSFPAVSKTNSQLSFNIQVPSENIIVNREILLRATLDFTMYIKVQAQDTQALNLCGEDALSPFPLNQLFTTASAQINNTNVSCNTADILPIILQLADQRELSTYNDMCPALLDTFYAKFADTFISDAGSVGTHGASTTTGIVAAYPQTATSSLYQRPANNSPLAGYNQQSLDGAYRPRGAFPLRVVSIRRSSATAASNVAYSLAAGDEFYVALQVDVVEPIIGLSPFTYGNNQFNKAGLVGINNMNFVFNVDSTLSRLMCNAVSEDTADTQTYYKLLTCGHSTATGLTSGTTDLFNRAELLINFLSSQPTDLIPARNVVPYVDLPRFITTASNSIATAVYKNTSSTTGIWGIQPTNQTFISQGIQLNQLPDYFIIAVRVKVGSNLYQNRSGHPQEFAPHFLPITGISVNLNNTSGLLSSASQADLYRISCANHSKQTWDAFRGRARVYQSTTSVGTAATLGAAITTTGMMGFRDIPTIGSVLVLNPAYDLSIPDYLSSGSLGAYNFQFQVTCENYHVTSASITPEIVVICANSGVFSTIAGSSNIYTGILTKSMVLDAKKEAAENPIMSSQYERMVGGAMMPNNAMSGEMPLIKEFKASVGKSRGSMGSGVMSGGSRFSHLTR